MKQTLQELQVSYEAPIPILCDNTSTISISKNLVLHSKTKKIPIKNRLLREKVVEGFIKLHYVAKNDQFANILINPLLKAHSNNLGNGWELFHLPIKWLKLKECGVPLKMIK